MIDDMTDEEKEALELVESGELVSPAFLQEKMKLSYKEGKRLYDWIHKWMEKAYEENK